jgi:hypothetical protein
MGIADKNEFITLNKLFKDGKTGYNSFEKMINGEFGVNNYNDVKEIFDLLIKRDINVTFGSGNQTMNYYNGGFKIDPKSLVHPLDACKTKYPQLLEQAKNWWIKWLSSPITKQKFIKKNGEKDFKKYYPQFFEAIKKLKLDYYLDNSEKSVGNKTEIDDRLQTAYAFVDGYTPEYVYVNCSLNDDDALETLVHEIQHTLYNIYHYNDWTDIGNVFTKKGESYHGYTIGGGTSLEMKDVIPQINKISTQLGISPNYLKNYFKFAKDSNTDGYACEHTESMSRIMAMRKTFNIKPGQNITYEMIKPYITGEKEHGEIGWILICWALNGFEDINLLLNKMNKLVYQDTKPTDNTRLT